MDITHVMTALGVAVLVGIGVTFVFQEAFSRARDEWRATPSRRGREWDGDGR